MSVTDRIANVQKIFREVSELSQPITSWEEQLAVYRGDFISVAYESAASLLAKNDLLNGDSTLPQWVDFKDQFSEKHASQIHVGLGWATAETDHFPDDFIRHLSPAMQWRIFDGYGYYSGLFKRREALRMQQYPSFFDEEGKQGFDQGLGRSLWYISQGDPDRSSELIALFPEERRRNLWRGIGLAATYVGGLEKTTIEKLIDHSGKYLPALRFGALIAIDGRSKSNTLNQDTSLIQNLLHLPDKILWPEEAVYSEVLRKVEGELSTRDV